MRIEKGTGLVFIWSEWIMNTVLYILSDVCPHPLMADRGSSAFWVFLYLYTREELLTGEWFILFNLRGVIPALLFKHIEVWWHIFASTNWVVIDTCNALTLAYSPLPESMFCWHLEPQTEPDYKRFCVLRQLSLHILSLLCSGTFTHHSSGVRALIPQLPRFRVPYAQLTEE